MAAHGPQVRRVRLSEPVTARVGENRVRHPPVGLAALPDDQAGASSRSTRRVSPLRESRAQSARCVIRTRLPGAADR